MKAVETGERIRPDFADGYQAALVDEAIATSGATHEWVKVEPVQTRAHAQR
jgi:hypothetical protein